VAECCPACGGSAGRSFYGVPALPVHSTRMLATREAALAFPRRPLELVACPHCGFIFNRCFDATLQGYGGDCEESQGCSATFRRWLEALVHRLVEAHGVRGRQVLEIGCGKGEFLAALCRAGANRGIGYDPTHVAGRAGPGEGDLWQVQREFWSVDKGIHGAAFIACRHTLEHIAPVGDFLRELRAAIGSARPLLFFEVPDAGRILAEGAFWDVYYEHCSYFTAASLRGLFLRAGFEVLNLWHDFDDQYLLLLARPAPGGAPAVPAAVDSGLAGQLVQFDARVTAAREHWSAFLDQCRTRGESVVLWGGSSKASAFLSVIDHAGVIERVVDIDPHKQGSFVAGTGQPVLAPRALCAAPPRHVILANPIYAEEVRAELAALGLDPTLHAL
jgi:hypothetical protein